MWAQVFLNLFLLAAPFLNLYLSAATLNLTYGQANEQMIVKVEIDLNYYDFII